KGADEPFWGKRTPESLAHAFSVVKALDPSHELVTIQAPKPDTADGLPTAGAADALAPYEAVTDFHGVDVYPVAYGNADPDLHRVGAWTQTIVKATPKRPVIAALQICFSGSDDPAGSGAFVMPTARQERFMIYDAIMNGARGLSFFGGTVASCLTGDDQTRGFNWKFWNDVLAPLVSEIGERSPMHAALLAYGTGLGLTTDDTLTQVMSRRVERTGEIWVFTGRRGATPATLAVKVSGLPKTIAHGEVVGENRMIDVKDGSFTDDHARWDVHVYRFTE
ncbi:MAG TPA: hypothetical protein VIF62_25695, partial [Labilithrix sp.]